MKRHCLFVLLAWVPLSICQAQVPSAQLQIAAAVMAAPEEKRSGATVLGYDASGDLVTLRQGSNEMICLADDPDREGFSVACYHKDLEPLMARGRELRREGKNFREVAEIREEEAKKGILKMPDQPTTLHILSGKDGKFDPTTGEVTNAFLRFVIYIPYATAEATGLPTKPTGPGTPWLMDAGTYRAHIMITPPRPETGGR